MFENELELETGRRFKFSEEFMQLIVWMYSKRKKKECEESEFELNEYIDTLKKINHEFSHEIKIGFKSVLQDVLKVRNDSGLIKKFTFPKNGKHELNFNFKRFESYLLKGETEKIIINVGW